MREIPIQCLAVPDKIPSNPLTSTSIGDENDPHAINRNKFNKPSYDRKLSPPKKQSLESQDDGNKNSAFQIRRSASASRSQPRVSNEYQKLSEEKNLNTGVVTRSRKQAVIPLNTKQTNPSVLVQQQSTHGTSTGTGTGTGTTGERRGYVRQFEVYNENKPTSTRINQQLHLSGDMVPKRSKTCERERRISSSSNSSSNDHQRPSSSNLRLGLQRYASDILPDDDTEPDNENQNNSQLDALNEGVYMMNENYQNNDNMEIVNHNNGHGGDGEEEEEEGVQEIQHNMEKHFKIKNSILETNKNHDENLLNDDLLDVVNIPNACGDAWALCDMIDDGVVEKTTTTTTTGARASAVPSTVGSGPGSGGALNKKYSLPSSSTGYMTPPKSKSSSDGNGDILDYPDTLECMYQNLELSFHPSNAITPATTTPLEGQQPKIWVVKYVDYTSKYGLGFLLNTNSAGVYFNDSTKIILSPDGTIFQYIERRRRGSTGVIEHLIHTHSLRSYPTELTKKVTLLKHFKSYLMDQLTSQQQQTQTQPSLTAGGGDDQNPTWLNTYLDKTIVMQSDTLILPYVKKWVRTRHAILFRLSNRTVQVVFFDNR